MVAAATFAPVPETPTTAPANRDARGRFAKGNRGGPGNPFARRVGALRKTLLDQLTAEDVAAVGQALLAKARAGDVAAAKLLFSYVLGKPAQAVDPDQLDTGEWELLRGEATRACELGRLLLAIRPEPALEEARASLQKMVEDWEHDLAEGLTTEQRELAEEARKQAQQPAKKDPPPSPIGDNGRLTDTRVAPEPLPPTPIGSNGRLPDTMAVVESRSKNGIGPPHAFFNTQG